MKQTVITLAQHYLTALRKHLTQGPRANMQPALKLGHQAVALGLETLELARIHERALVTLELSNLHNSSTRWAEIFFNKAITPIVETHRTTRQGNAHLSKLMADLEKRTKQLAITRLQLQKSTVRRKVVEDGFAKRGQNQQKCLAESLQLQNRLRQLTHQVLAAQEEERKKISTELQDEIAQTLLGINVRLLSLKREARSNTTGLKNEIASTQRLVIKSARFVRQVARKFRNA